MKSEVVDFLHRVEKAKLFSNVGQPTHGEDVVEIHSWAEAYRSCNSQAWEDFGIDRHNEMNFGEPNDIEFWEQHDSFVASVREMLDDLVRPIVTDLNISPAQQERILNSTRWQLLGTAVEIEYRHLTDSTWHRELARWFLRGHFPCGWEGHWPERGERSGRLIVY